MRFERIPPGLAACSISLMLIGLVSRVAPLFDHGGRLLRQFPTEDGFLMSTVARNLALGHGLSTADGAIPTNGIQPLFTFVQSLAFLLVGGDKRTGVLLILLVEIALALCGAWLIYRLTVRLLSGRVEREALARMAASLWFVSPVVVCHSMNCLETGLYTVLVLATLHVWYAGRPHAPRTKTGLSSVYVGLLSGLAFWARNDAVYLLAAIVVWHLILGFRKRKGDLAVRLREALVMVSGASVLAMPWLVYNLKGFGHIVPISVLSQTLTRGFADNLVEVPSKLFEFMTFLAPIPTALETKTAVVIITTIATMAFFVSAIVIARRSGGGVSAFIHAGLAYAVFLTVNYGLYFGAPYFVSRYLFPLSPFMAVLAVVMGVSVLRMAPRVVYAALLVSVVVLATALNLRLYVKGSEHQYFQVVDWVSENVAEESWVGAPQSGTVGFFHDRTVNLDGKVNPEALQAKLRGKLPEYVATRVFDDTGRRIDYIADWHQVSVWLEYPEISSHFELRVHDVPGNLTVLQRK